MDDGKVVDVLFWGHGVVKPYVLKQTRRAEKAHLTEKLEQVKHFAPDGNRRWERLVLVAKSDHIGRHFGSVRFGRCLHMALFQQRTALANSQEPEQPFAIRRCRLGKHHEGSRGTELGTNLRELISWFRSRVCPQGSRVRCHKRKSFPEATSHNRLRTGARRAKKVGRGEGVGKVEQVDVRTVVGDDQNVGRDGWGSQVFGWRACVSSAVIQGKKKYE